MPRHALFHFICFALVYTYEMLNIKMSITDTTLNFTIDYRTVAGVNGPLVILDNVKVFYCETCFYIYIPGQG